MSVLVVGSVAIDSVETPFGKDPEAVGGSALHFSAASKTYAPIHVVGIAGEDFPWDKIEFLKQHDVDLSGLTTEKGKTFRWGGKYHKNMNRRDTLFTDLNVFENFKPVIPDHYKDDKFVFLANIQPQLQHDVLDQLTKPELVVLDTMNLWIDIARESLLELINRVDVLIVNDEELFDLTGKHSLYEGASEVLSMGPRAIVVKKGEHGAVLIDSQGVFLAPAYPVEQVMDPTGAGDSFAGGFLGYLAREKNFDDITLRNAIAHGAVVASFIVEDFSFNRLRDLRQSDIDSRVEHLRKMTQF
ncbi:MAG: PfkB family carbohydrate kinase [Calditrichia bacterium]